MARGGVTALVLAFSLFPLRGADAPPLFKDFPVARIYHGVVKPPILGSIAETDQVAFHCVGEPGAAAADQHVNFAGHFVIGACSCGSGCHYLFMWDAIGGRFHRQLPPGMIDVGPYDMAGPNPVEYKGEEYRIDSSLLIVDGCVEDTCDCATRYYRWDGRAFREISSRISLVPAKCRK